MMNGVSVTNLLATVDAIKTTPAIAKFNFRIANQWDGGSHNHSTVNEYYGAGQDQSRPKPFVVKSDEPVVLLGEDKSANPVEYLLHALAACLTTSLVYHAAARGIELQEVESTLEGDIDLRGFFKLEKNIRTGYQGIRVNFKIKGDFPDDQLQSIVNLGPDHSPVFDSLVNGVPVAVSAERL
jgi:uncharacterized OsmC-like protein